MGAGGGDQPALYRGEACGLRLGEGDAMRLARAAVRERPGEGVVEADAGRQVATVAVGNRHGGGERRAVERVGNVERKGARVDFAALGIVLQLEADVRRALLHEREDAAAGEAVLGQGIVAAVEPVAVARQPAHDREEDRRVARPIGGIGVGHQLAALRVAQRHEFGAERVDRRRERAVADLHPISHAGWLPAWRRR